MPLTKLQFRPGINREVTAYTHEGGWVDGNKIRFRAGSPETIGGWVRQSDSQLLGVCRALLNWTTLAGANLIGIGTHLKYYVDRGGTLNDITPIRFTTAAGDVTFAATDGSTVLTVNDTAHGGRLNDFVTFSDAESLGGSVTAAVLNAEYQIARVTSLNSYEVTLAVAATAADTGTGEQQRLRSTRSTAGLRCRSGVTVGARTRGAPVAGVKPQT